MLIMQQKKHNNQTNNTFDGTGKCDNVYFTLYIFFARTVQHYNALHCRAENDKFKFKIKSLNSKF